MNVYEAAAFYGDYSMLLAEIAKEAFDEKVECSIVAAKFFEANSSAKENSVLNLELV